jgi:hypothetical protein
LNFILNSGQILNNINFSDQKINEGNKKLSINNLTPQTDVTSSPGSYKKNLDFKNEISKENNSKYIINSNSIKKEIMYEKPNFFSNSSKSRERKYSKDKSSKGSFDLANQTQTYTSSIEKERKNSVDKNNVNTNIAQLNYTSGQILNDFNSCNNVKHIFIIE